MKTLMVKLTLIISLASLTQSTYSQGFNECIKCNEMFDKDIRSTHTAFQRLNFKQFLSEYFASSEDKRRDMKKNRANSFGLETVVESLPIKLSFGSSSNNSSKFIHQMFTEHATSGSISDEKMNSFLSSEVPNIAFESYQLCLSECGSSLKNDYGVYLNLIEEGESTIIVEVKNGISIGLQPVTIESISIAGGYIIGNPQLKPGAEIKGFSSLSDIIQKDKDKEFSLVINFVESGVSSLSVQRPATTSRYFSQMPTGTIIFSTLDYASFCSINAMDENFDNKSSTWAPCDGRLVLGSKYGRRINNVPDLRGIFVRGVNDMGVSGQPTPVDNAYRNEENTLPGQRQEYALRSHNHKYTKANDVNDGIYSSYQRAAPGFGKYYHNNDNSVATPINDNIINWSEAEVRPNNMSVFYYIKIN